MSVKIVIVQLNERVLVCEGFAERILVSRARHWGKRRKRVVTQVQHLMVDAGRQIGGGLTWDEYGGGWLRK